MADAPLKKDAPAQNNLNPHLPASSDHSNGRPTPTPSPAPAAVLSVSVGPAKMASTSMSPTRPPYIPQFTATTQMILKRMKAEPNNLSSVLSAASNTGSLTSSIKPATYEEVKQRLVRGMNTTSSMTLKMPMPSPAPAPPPKITSPNVPPGALPQSSSSYLAVPTPTPGPSKSKPVISAIRRISSGLTMGGKPITTKPPPVKNSVKPPAAKNPTVKSLAAENKVVKKSRAPRAAGTITGRRKNPREDDSSSLSSLSDLSGDESFAAQSPAVPKTQPHTMTKSGRQVQKPLTYNPADMEASGSRKRTHYGKRTTEQALCKKCSRMYSPSTNQMVFCDGCNEGWHQRCHDPWITEDMVRDQNKSWFCSACQAKREPRPPPAKKQKTEPPKQPVKESWAGKSVQQKRAYLSTLQQQDLVALLMQSLELHPDLPIFPGQDNSNNSTNNSNTNGSRPSSRSGTKNGGRNGTSKKEKEGSQEKGSETTTVAVADDLEEEFDPLVALWPKAGQGLYAQLPPDTEDNEHLVDDGDYEAFSTIVFDKGKKVMENGMKVVR